MNPRNCRGLLGYFYVAVVMAFPGSSVETRLICNWIKMQLHIDNYQLPLPQFTLLSTLNASAIAAA
ncbi:hypothetical protein MiSe_18140 [Microseira wollei NIES-4236]|uniref:Secreted protein n=1 Tax=Microseira wollei NIES-4236 TaxID=2530354 RepID=A0AAV3X8U2_9CYAN|nr:hypothetical protein MiSe_18140 [Microseira wollei NIES-4236]